MDNISGTHALNNLSTPPPKEKSTVYWQGRKVLIIDVTVQSYISAFPTDELGIKDQYKFMNLTSQFESQLDALIGLQPERVKYDQTLDKLLQNISESIDSILAYHPDKITPEAIVSNLFYYYLDSISKTKSISLSLVNFLYQQIKNNQDFFGNHYNHLIKDLVKILTNKPLINDLVSNEDTKPYEATTHNLSYMCVEQGTRLFDKYKKIRNNTIFFELLEMDIVRLHRHFLPDPSAQEIYKSFLHSNKIKSIERTSKTIFTSLQHTQYPIEALICIIYILQNGKEKIQLPISFICDAFKYISSVDLNDTNKGFLSNRILSLLSKFVCTHNINRDEIHYLFKLMKSEKKYHPINQLLLPLSPFSFEENHKIFYENPDCYLLSNFIINPELFIDDIDSLPDPSDDDIKGSIETLKKDLKRIGGYKYFLPFKSNRIYRDFFKRDVSTQNIDNKLIPNSSRLYGSKLAFHQSRKKFVSCINLIKEMNNSAKLKDDTKIAIYKTLSNSLSSCLDGFSKTLELVHTSLISIHHDCHNIDFILEITNHAKAYIFNEISKRVQIYTNYIVEKSNANNQQISEVHHVNFFTQLLKRKSSLYTPSNIDDKHARIPDESDFGDTPNIIKKALDARFCSDHFLNYMACYFQKNELARDAYVHFFKTQTDPTFSKEYLSHIEDATDYELFSTLFPEALENESTPWKPDLFFWIYFLKHNIVLIEKE